MPSNKYDEMLERMQTPEARAGMKRAFDATPKELGQAAVRAALRPDQPCAHPGCLSHVSHPCEGCGRIAGYDPGACKSCGGLMQHKAGCREVRWKED